MKKHLTIVTITLAYYHEILYWCLYTEHQGKIREDLLNRPTGGKQIPFAFEKALEMDGDILIITDDKFGFEKKNNKGIPADEEIKSLLKNQPLPKTWLQKLEPNGGMSRIIVPPPHLACGAFSFSEKLLYTESKKDYDLHMGECANEWTFLVERLEKEGYEKIHAFVPLVCAKGICFSTSYATKEAGILTKPITIDFTERDGITFQRYEW